MEPSKLLSMDGDDQTPTRDVLLALSIVSKLHSNDDSLEDVFMQVKDTANNNDLLPHVLDEGLFDDFNEAGNTNEIIQCELLASEHAT